MDATFSANIPDGVVSSVDVQPDGKILLAGSFTQADGQLRNHIARLNSDGSLDVTFDPRAGPNDYIYSIVLQNDGRMIVLGGFDQIDGLMRKALARLNGFSQTANPDFNGDGFADYLLFNANSRGSAVWHLKWSPLSSWSVWPYSARGLEVAAAADFNQDGKPDLVLFNPNTGQTAVWYLNDSSYIGST